LDLIPAESATPESVAKGPSRAAIGCGSVPHTRSLGAASCVLTGYPAQLGEAGPPRSASGQNAEGDSQGRPGYPPAPTRNGLLAFVRVLHSARFGIKHDARRAVLEVEHVEQGPSLCVKRLVADSS
jgi:hypothetical protein